MLIVRVAMRYIRSVVLFALFLSFWGCGPGEIDSARSCEQTTVILVRHAERADDSQDSELSLAGQERADFLARMLKDSDADALYASEYKRTQQTLRPLAEELGLPIQILPAESSEELIGRIFAENTGGVAVVASHSDRIPPLIETLTGDRVEAIDHNEYSRLYILTLTGAGQGRAIELRFGNPDPESSPPMSTTKP